LIPSLRLLLSYHARLLAPDQIRQIEQSLSEQPGTRQLLERIRQAEKMPAASSSLDTNLLAEYLDNSLATDVAAVFERGLLQSDVGLAEVVACHQILTRLVREPIQVPADSHDYLIMLIEDATHGEQTPEINQPPPRGDEPRRGADVAQQPRSAPASPVPARDNPPVVHGGRPSDKPPRLVPEPAIGTVSGQEQMSLTLWLSIMIGVIALASVLGIATALLLAGYL
jgi:hypothetical protein